MNLNVLRERPGLFIAATAASLALAACTGTENTQTEAVATQQPASPSPAGEAISPVPSVTVMQLPCPQMGHPYPNQGESPDRSPYTGAHSAEYNFLKAIVVDSLSASESPNVEGADPTLLETKMDRIGTRSIRVKGQRILDESFVYRFAVATDNEVYAELTPTGIKEWVVAHEAILEHVSPRVLARYEKTLDDTRLEVVERVFAKGGKAAADIVGPVLKSKESVETLQTFEALSTSSNCDKQAEADEMFSDLLDKNDEAIYDLYGKIYDAINTLDGEGF